MGRAMCRAYSGVIRETLPAVCAPAHAIELSAEAFARPTLSSNHFDARCNLADDRRRAPVDVAGDSNRSADARFDRLDHLDDPLAFRDQGMDLVTGTDLGRRLDRMPVDLNMAALAQLR